MGNILITALSIFIPITIHTSIIPTIMRPDILGGNPWSPPSTLFYVILYYSIMYFILWFLSFLGNTYYSLFNCGKVDGPKSALYANYTPLFSLAGVFVNNTLLLPFVKSMILGFTTAIPYSHHFVNGFINIPFVFLGTMFSQRYLNKAVCGFF